MLGSDLVDCATLEAGQDDSRQMPNEIVAWDSTRDLNVQANQGGAAVELPHDLVKLLREISLNPGVVGEEPDEDLGISRAWIEPGALL